MGKKYKTTFTSILKSVILKDTHIKKYYKYKSPNTKYKLDDILTNIIYVLKTGISWRSLSLNPTIKWQAIYFHFNRFVRFGIFKKLFLQLRYKYIKNNNSNIKLIDSSFIMNKYGRNKIARNKFFKNKNCNKISVLTDVNGIPLSVLVNKGTIHDSKFFIEHFNDVKFSFKNKCKNDFCYLLADKAYESKKIRDELTKSGYALMVSPKKNLKTKYYFDKILYKKRINVEHTFQRLKVFKRIQIRYDMFIENYYGFLYLASSILIYNKF
jgi:transposase